MQPFRLLAYGGHLEKSVLRKKFPTLKRIIFSDYVTVALVRVINFSLILFIEQTRVQRTTPVLIKQTPLKPSGFLLSHNVCYTFVTHGISLIGRQKKFACYVLETSPIASRDSKPTEYSTAFSCRIGLKLVKLHHLVDTMMSL